jgi:hypothetical protein
MFSDAVQLQRRRRFTDSEDGLLNRLVEQLGTESWATIATGIPGRTARQCRSRWKHYLSGRQDVAWTQDEDDLIEEKVAEIGAKWTRIGQLLKNRTDIEVKARWQYLYQKRRNSLFRQVYCDSERRTIRVVGRGQERRSADCHGDEFGNVKRSELLEHEIEWRTASDRSEFTDDDGDNMFQNWFYRQ